MSWQFLSKKIKTALPVIMFLPIYLLWFSALEKIPQNLCVRVDIPLDRAIPFIKYFIVPYALWPFFIFVVAVYVLFTDEALFKKFQKAFIAGMVLYLTINTFYTTSLSLRPVAVVGSDIFARLVRGLYSIDTPTNVYPSMHVYTTVLTFIMGFEVGVKDKYRKVFHTFVFTMSILIVLSTVFLKQHSIKDVFAGIILAFFMWKLPQILGYYFPQEFIERPWQYIKNRNREKRNGDVGRSV